MIEALRKFEKKEPELILSWTDHMTEAKGWLVINSLRGGAAGGGTRMKKNIDFQEVFLLAKTMEIKFTVSGPPIGGAKSGIDFDPMDPRKAGVLERWYKAIRPMLKACYGTGGDLNTDFINEVVPITKEIGILHPQEGILEGYLHGNSKARRISRLVEGTTKTVRDLKYAPDSKDKFTIADLISGFGVAESVAHYYSIFRENIKGKRAIIQGWGNVGSSTGYYLSKSGVKIIGIVNIDGGVINEMGFEPDEIREFMLKRRLNPFSGYHIIPYDEIMRIIWNLPAEIFIPAAASKLVTKNQVNTLIDNGLELIACGANVPFADEEHFYGSIAEYADNHVGVIPDFIANCGMARVFAYLMQDSALVTDEAIFQDVSLVVESALKETCNAGGKRTKIAQTFYNNALTQLV